MKVRLKNGDSFIEVDTENNENIEETYNEELKENKIEDTIELKLNLEETNETDGN